MDDGNYGSMHRNFPVGALEINFYYSFPRGVDVNKRTRNENIQNIRLIMGNLNIGEDVANKRERR